MPAAEEEVFEVEVCMVDAEVVHFADLPGGFGDDAAFFEGGGFGRVVVESAAVVDEVFGVGNFFADVEESAEGAEDGGGEDADGFGGSDAAGAGGFGDGQFHDGAAGAEIEAAGEAGEESAVDIPAHDEFWLLVAEVDGDDAGAAAGGEGAAAEAHPGFGEGAECFRDCVCKVCAHDELGAFLGDPGESRRDVWFRVAHVGVQGGCWV